MKLPKTERDGIQALFMDVFLVFKLMIEDRLFPTDPVLLGPMFVMLADLCV